MEVTAIAAAQNSRSSAALTQLTGNIDTFLTLLTTQLRNQDPLNPLDTEKFTSQLVQFASVEQSIQTNANLETLISLQASADRQGALSMIGRTLIVEGDKAFNEGAGARWSYELPAGAAAAALTVVDEAGRAVAQSPGATARGDHVFNWNGRADDGSQAPPGVYRLVVSAVDAAGQAAPVRVSAGIDAVGVRFNADGLNTAPAIETGIGLVPLASVRRVIAAPQSGQ